MTTHPAVWRLWSAVVIMAYHVRTASSFRLRHGTDLAVEAPAAISLLNEGDAAALRRKHDRSSHSILFGGCVGALFHLASPDSVDFGNASSYVTPNGASCGNWRYRFEDVLLSLDAPILCHRWASGQNTLPVCESALVCAKLVSLIPRTCDARGMQVSIRRSQISILHTGASFRAPFGPEWRSCD